MKDLDIAFHEIIETHRALIFSVALSITKNFHDAEDVSQEVLMRVARNIDGFQARSSLKTWLTAIVRNTALNSIRRRAARPEVSLDCLTVETLPDSAPADPTARFDRTSDFLAATESMNPRERRAFLLRHYHGHSFAQIAQSLSTSAKNARLIVWRGTQKFRTRLKRQTRPDLQASPKRHFRTANFSIES